MVPLFYRARQHLFGQTSRLDVELKGGRIMGRSLRLEIPYMAAPAPAMRMPLSPMGRAVVCNILLINASTTPAVPWMSLLEGAEPVLESIQLIYGVRFQKDFPLKEYMGEDLANGLHEPIYEGLAFRSTDTRLPQPRIERISSPPLIIGSHIQHDRERGVSVLPYLNNRHVFFPGFRIDLY
jgi:hypothetical protein